MSSYIQIENVSLYQCSLDRAGLKTVDFPTRAACDSYFASCNDSFCQISNIGVFANGYYQRENGIIKLKANADDLNNRGINYCRWQNPNMGSTMWFYGFIDQISYSAAKTALLSIRLDPWMTYFDRITFGQSTIKRETACHDGAKWWALHPAAENISIDNTMIFDTEELLGGFNGQDTTNLDANFWALIICATSIANYPDADNEYYDFDAKSTAHQWDGVGFLSYSSSVVGGMPNLLTYYAVRPTNLKWFFDKFIDSKDSQDVIGLKSGDVLGVTLVHTDAIAVSIATSGPSDYDALKFAFPHQPTNPFFSFDLGTMVNGYRPYNKKLLTYPYQSFYVTNYNGQGVELQPEKYLITRNIDDEDTTGTTNITFRAAVALGMPTISTVFPTGYEVAAGDTNANLNVNLISTTIPYITSAYKNYMIQNAASIAQQKRQAWTSAIGGIVSTAIAGFISPALGVLQATNAFNQTLNSASAALDAAKGSDLAMGTFSTAISSLNAANSARQSAVANARQANIATGTQIISQGINSAINGINTAGAINASIANAQAQPSQVVGSPDGSILNMIGKNGITCELRAITYAVAEQIDYMLSRYGCATNRNWGYPDIRGRQYYNYIQTENCVIKGNIPQNYKSQLENLFNSGFSIWHDLSIYGNTVMNNPIINSHADYDPNPYQ